MHGSMPRRLALALFAMGVLTHGVALAEGDVSVALNAYRVTMSQGKEAFVPAEQAKPGEIIEYRATYKNTGKQPVKDLMATLPVPQGLEYLPRTASPSKLFASTDGVLDSGDVFVGEKTQSLKVSPGKSKTVKVKAKAMGLLQSYATRGGWEPEAKKRAQDAADRVKATIKE